MISWINENSPHKPEWAHTEVKFVWGGGFKISGNDQDGYKLSVVKATVTMTKSVDMPQWSPSDKAMQTTWNQGYATLRAHEAQHEAIGDTWKAELLKRLQALSLPVSDKNQDAATSQSMVQAEWDSWLAEHQAAQEAIDPYTATLNCPPEPETPEADSEGETEGDDS